MPTYHDFTWKDYKVSVRPIGWRRIFQLIPYLNGTNVNLAITVSTRSNEKREFVYTWILFRWDGENQHRQAVGDKLFIGNPQSRFRENLDIPYLSIPDHYYIHARLYDKESDTSSDWQVVANFTLLERDVTVSKIIFSALLLLLGAGLAKLVEWLIRVIS